MEPPPNDDALNCVGRQQFDRWSRANRAVTRRTRQSAAQIWRCRHCRAWHIATVDRKWKVKPR